MKEKHLQQKQEEAEIQRRKEEEKLEKRKESAKIKTEWDRKKSRQIKSAQREKTQIERESTVKMVETKDMKIGNGKRLIRRD